MRWVNAITAICLAVFVFIGSLLPTTMANAEELDIGNGWPACEYEFENDPDNGRLCRLDTQRGVYQYEYDEAGRLTDRKLSVEGKPILIENYVYFSDRKVGQLVSFHTPEGLERHIASYLYTYDDNGKLASVSGDLLAQYTYDPLGRLESEIRNGSIATYIYDDAGNLRRKKEDDYVLNLGYDSTIFGDLLSSYGETEVTIGSIGNPIRWYNGAEFAWINRSRLACCVSEQTSVSFTYDKEGARASKLVSDENGTVAHKYIWAGDKLVQEDRNDTKLTFYYDERGYPGFFFRNEEPFFYVRSIQGDVLQILDQEGRCVGEYKYDAWGGVLNSSGEMADINPLRYRGYYYDDEMALYHIGDRFYDPRIGRYVNVGNDVFDENESDESLFVYCCNDPVNNSVGNKMDCEVDTQEDAEVSQQEESCKPWMNLSYQFSEDEKIFISTMVAEATVTAAGEYVSKTARQAIAHVIMNRICSREWAYRWNAAAVCAYSGFDGYESEDYMACMKYLEERDGSNIEYEQIIQDVMPIYCGEAEDFTMGAQLFYTPSAMEPGKQSPGWNFDLLEEVIIPGIDPYYEGRFFRYK